MRSFTRESIVGTAATVLLLLTFAHPAAADEAFPGCIAGVEPLALVVKTSWGAVLTLDTTEFANANGHVIANDECYQFWITRTEDGRLLLRAIEAIAEETPEDDQDRSRN